MRAIVTPHTPPAALRTAAPASNLAPYAALAALASVAPSVRIVGTAEVELVERLGAYNRMLRPGLHILIPFVEQVSFKGTTRERVLDIPPKPAITSDNAPLSVDAVVYWRIVDAMKARYEVTDLETAVQNLVTTQLRSEVGKLTLDQTFSARQQINAALLDQLNGATSQWGIEVLRVELQSIRAWRASNPRLWYPTA